ncbi:MAG: Dabb family protein [Phycisphaeraceae bacterium]
MFIHMVFFWLKDGTSAVQQAALEQDCRQMLGQVPGVRQLWAGKPAMTPRDVVDNSYHVGLCVVLDDQAGHDAYQVHDLHQQFIARHKPHWQRVQVYDFAE